MPNIDLREDPRIDLAIAGQIGGAIGLGLADYRRNRIQKRIVAELSRGMADDLKPEEIRQNILKIPNVIDTEIGQQAAIIEAGLGTAYESPLDIQYRTAQIESSKASAEASKARRAHYEALGGQGRLADAKRVQMYKHYQDIYNDAHMQWMNADPDDPARIRLKSQMEWAQRHMQDLEGVDTERMDSIQRQIDYLRQQGVSEEDLETYQQLMSRYPEPTQTEVQAMETMATKGATKAPTDVPVVPISMMEKPLGDIKTSKPAAPAKQVQGDIESLKVDLGRYTFQLAKDRDFEQQGLLLQIIEEGDIETMTEALRRLREKYGTSE